MTRSFAAAAAFAALLLSTAGAHAAAPAPIAAAVADPGRPAADTARDAARKPADVLAFAGVKPGMVVAELGSGGGYYTRILSKAVGPQGKVFAVATRGQAARPGGLDALNAIAAAYPNVTVVTVPDLASIMLPEKADLFWTTENYHDFHNGPAANVPGMDKAVFDNLKAGGVFYVEDHSAAPGAGLEAAAKFHRMDEAVAKTELLAAGFKIDGEGDLLRNPNDNRATSNSEAGHFVTDRFMLRLKK
ncbi:MAG TPA: methyltransferase [Caulobacteraceae bacterium]|jgi:predicted methyltransferase|nr:methyltransferase [Caulobacteraceae bacterium]